MENVPNCVHHLEPNWSNYMNYGTREYRFEIAKRYKFRDCDYYAGRNCVLWVEIAGTRNPTSAMIMDLGDLDDGIEKILTNYDHTTINYSFTELTERLWKAIRGQYNLVRKIRLYVKNHIWYDKGDNDFMDVTRRYAFSAAHKTENQELDKKENVALYGKCNTLHGHEYTLEVTVRGTRNEKGFIIDSDFMDSEVTHVLRKYDKQILNEVPGMPGKNATTENFIRVLWNDLEEWVKDERYKLYKLRLRETARNFFDYYGEK